MKIEQKDQKTLCSITFVTTPSRQLHVQKINNDQWRRSGVFIVIFEHISHLVLMLLLFSLSRQMAAGQDDFRDLQGVTCTSIMQVNFCQIYPISGRCSNFVPPENVRKPKIFCSFQGVPNGNIG